MSCAGRLLLRRVLERRLDGVEVDIRYPTYTFAGVLCTHGHYLDFHARRSGTAPGRLLARVLWSIAVGGEEHAPTIEDYEATITLLTALLYTIAQLPNGTQAQRRAFGAFKALERTIRVARAPVIGRRARPDLATGARRLLDDRDPAAAHASGEPMPGTEEARSREEARRRRRPVRPAAARRPATRWLRLGQPERPGTARGRGVRPGGQEPRLGAGHRQIVFAHTHQPLEDVTAPGGTVRYWNTGSWIYEPDLSSREAYLAYLRNGWPGTAVLIDSEEAQPRLLRLREHLNPLRQMT